MNRMLITSQFAVPEEIPQFVNLIRKSIAGHEGGTEKLDAREKIGRSYENVIPAGSICISVLLILFYILQQELIDSTDPAFALLRAGGLNRHSVLTGEYFRLTGSLFLHLNAFHLLVNIFTLMVFGNLIEHIILKANLVTIFLLSGLFSSLLSIISGQYVVTIGASGGVYGIIGAYIFIRIKYRDTLPSFVRLQQGWILFFIFFINMLYSLFDSNIDFFCHFGGLVTGFLYITLLSHYKNHRISTLGEINRITKSLLLIMSLFYLYNFISLNHFIQAYKTTEDYRDYFIQSVLSEDSAGPSDQVINFVSYDIAKQDNSSIEMLKKVRAKMEFIVKKRPENHQCIDTLALIYFRLGLLNRAIELQKRAVSLDKNKGYKLQLKRFEKYKANKTSGKT